MLSSLNINEAMQNMENNERDKDEHLNLNIPASKDHSHAILQTSMEALESKEAVYSQSVIEIVDPKEAVNSQAVIEIVDPKDDDFEAVETGNIAEVPEVPEVKEILEEDGEDGWGKNKIFWVLAAMVCIFMIGYGINLCYYKQEAILKDQSIVKVEEVQIESVLSMETKKDVSTEDQLKKEVPKTSPVYVKNTYKKKEHVYVDENIQKSNSESLINSQISDKSKDMKHF
jgi:hypothetical protein